ncbi:frequency clock protein [Fusarium flagelliforme]|uniref:frequency clock protein n=1 Tax=Fusarium flagelliforme TaxID=2675880 RepID=UPI001E8ED9B9|nr:frequency clock protein [Fusarium flagelliforme]KAH7184786.1 frequency clock protein [Fusarium flagelliforme]
MPSNSNGSHRTAPPPADYSLSLNSLTGSHETTPSDPPKRHNGSSHNATADNAIDVNISLHQEKSYIWNPEKSALHTQYQVAPHIPATVHSSSVDDYRGVIDDLTVEIQQLKKELKRYKQRGPARLHKDKLFETKVHGLPQKKRTELEAILRDFATDPDGSPEMLALQKRTKTSPHNNEHIYSKSGVMREHAPSSPGSSLRPPDSAYASISAGAVSPSTTVNLPILTSARPTKGKVEDYLRDVPDGLYPRHVIMTDKERKSLVVCRLEQLFTGRSNDAGISKIPFRRPGGSFIKAHVVAEAQVADSSSTHEPLTHATEPIREARILPLEQRSHTWRNNCHSSDCGSAPDPNRENMETRGGGGGLASDGKLPSLALPLSKQRPTRPCDLDPDRAQNSSENLNYIRHLYLLPPELLPTQQSIQGIYPDTGGWVSLNLLCNLAQLHLVNVTPVFVRSAVSKLSTRLQLSSDGHKILWRGGSEDTKFSGYNTPETPLDSNVDGSQKKGKRQKTSHFTANESQLGSLSKGLPAFDSHLRARVESFRYKPLFALQDSSDGHTLRGASVCSSVVETNTNCGESGLGLKYSAGWAGKRQRHEGAITYYSGAGFYTDLAGDSADPSLTTSTPSNVQTRKDAQQPSEFARSPRRISRSSISYMPSTDECQDLRQKALAVGGDKNQVQGLTNDGSEHSSDVELDLIWNNDQQYIRHQPLEPCGLGGVRPDDHFTVFVDTKRPKHDASQIGRSDESIERIIRRQEAMSTSGPVLGGSETKAIKELRSIEIEYLSWRTERLIPAPLPSPASFFPPFSIDSSMSGEDDDQSIDVYNSGSSEEDIC